eukprot:TRINITY_DN1807_c0_g1_i1.p2 TRINITY_DN1807_c0_g1~~TRINITY_DN1807_c0_g1_i1.p2  ORF type:complete len:129 (+),score=45.69 TRINITY_DN1807_c0_g1_i1:187-573(+)
MAPTMRRVLAALVVGLSGRTALATEFLGPADLHADMRSMMDDDGMDDVSDDDPTQPRQASGLLQKGAANSEDDMYMKESSNALTNALGDRWNGQELEANAKKQTTALLKGIAGHQDLGRLMGAMAAIR